MMTLRDILKPERLTAIVDVGAGLLDQKPPYQRMLEQGLCTVVGFEPQPDLLTNLNKAKGPNETYLPHAVGNGNQQILYLTGHQGMVSFLEPDPMRAGLFHGFPKWCEVKQMKPLPTVRLDDVAEIAHIDMLKADAQGSEIEVLRSGRYKLAKAVAIQVEVAFVPLYRRQPTLGEMDMELRAMGFMPHCFAGANVMPLDAPALPERSNDPHQIVDADILYIRDLLRPMEVEQLKQLAMIAHHVSGSFDLAMLLVGILSGLGAVPEDSCPKYRALLEAEQ